MQSRIVKSSCAVVIVRVLAWYSLWFIVFIVMPFRVFRSPVPRHASSIAIRQYLASAINQNSENFSGTAVSPRKSRLSARRPQPPAAAPSGLAGGFWRAGWPDAGRQPKRPIGGSLDQMWQGAAGLTNFGRAGGYLPAGAKIGGGLMVAPYSASSRRSRASSKTARTISSASSQMPSASKPRGICSRLSRASAHDSPYS